MATEAENASEQTVHAFRIAVIPDGASPASWTPPDLSPRPAAPPLDMHLGEKKAAVQEAKRTEGATFSPEPGMVFIPSGEFKIGSEDGARNEQPQRTVLLNGYWIDRYPVTNLDYMEFVDATGHRRPPHWVAGAYPVGHENHPVTNVSWNDAVAYAGWAGKRLSTEAEWEKAARGTQGQTYPWGDAFRKDNLNSSNDYEATTTPVSEFPRGASPYGVIDMCGNVMEFCSDWFDDDYYKTAPVDNPTGPEGGQYRVIRGGFYSENKSGTRCSSRYFCPPSTMQDHIGFRCAKTPLLPGQQPVQPKPAPQVQPAPPKPAVHAPISPDESVEQIASRLPESVAKAVRSLLAQADGEDTGLTPARKIGILFVVLGQETGAGVLKYLTDLEIERVAQALIDLDRIPPQQKDAALDEFKQLLVSGDYALHGGVDFARGTLEKALGPRKMQSLMDRLTSEKSSGFSMLRNVDPNQIIPFISKEHPQTISLILSQLDANQAAGVLNGLPREMQVNVASRIAQMENISPRVLRELEESLADDLQAILSGQIAEIGGPKAVAEILNRTGRSTEKAVLEHLDAQDPELAEEVRNQFFVFDDIANLTDREIQMILKEVDTKDLAIGLKGGSEEMQDRIFSNVSEEVGKLIKEEMQFSGPVRMSDVEEVQLRIVHKVRHLEEAGQVTIVRGDSSDTFV